jgi:hypothetical protein
MDVKPLVPTRPATPDMADVDGTEVAGEHGQPNGRHCGQMADCIGASQRTSHRPSLEEVPCHRLGVAVPGALDEGARANPHEMTRPDQRGHPVAAITALGQVSGERDPVLGDESKSQELIHRHSVAWRAGS